MYASKYDYNALVIAAAVELIGMVKMMLRIS